MIEVHPGLFVGDQSDVLAATSEPGWYIVHACKEPYHRAALGYQTVGAPKGHPEYYFAQRPGCTILNLVDVDLVSYIARDAVAAGVQAIVDGLRCGNKVLVHCNRGESRGPIIALLYLALHTDLFDDCEYDEALERFKALYPPFAPGAGMSGFARLLWSGDVDLEPPAQKIGSDPPDVTPRLTPRFDRRAMFRF